MYVSFLATFQYDMIRPTYFNQQAPTVSVFRIYHIETHMMNICYKKVVNLSLEFRIKTFCLRSSQMIMKQNLDKINSFVRIGKN